MSCFFGVKPLFIILLCVLVLWIGSGCTHSSPAKPLGIESGFSRNMSGSEMNRNGFRQSSAVESGDRLARSNVPGRSDSYSGANSLPSSPIRKSEQLPHEKARKLFEYARMENSNLRWNDCLARKALARAKTMVKDGNFDHKDPYTGRNPAWVLVASCFEPAYAGENLAKGERQSAKAIHEALMESPTHRRNILSPKFELVGVGCHSYICVQLFAGF